MRDTLFLFKGVSLPHLGEQSQRTGRIAAGLDTDEPVLQPLPDDPPF